MTQGRTSQISGAGGPAAAGEIQLGDLPEAREAWRAFSGRHGMNGFQQRAVILMVLLTGHVERCFAVNQICSLGLLVGTFEQDEARHLGRCHAARSGFRLECSWVFDDFCLSSERKTASAAGDRNPTVFRFCFHSVVLSGSNF